MSVLTIEKSQRVTTSTINLNRTEISDSSMVLIEVWVKVIEGEF
jgi:hypothetical protein